MLDVRMFDVRDFGAAGDGITDDSDAIAAAFAARHIVLRQSAKLIAFHVAAQGPCAW